ncbi:MAG: methylated-DNA--[protein]-cysteine S-methyltransferase [Bacteroidota bacterium]
MAAFMNQPGTHKVPRLLVNHWPQAQFLRAERPSHQIAQRLINKPTAKQTLQVYLSATPFQLNVWNQLLAIKCGQLTTYQAIADTLGTPNAARAVGQAIGHNPLAWLIPCHRVVRSDGQLGGFRWGMECKEKILFDELST